MNLNEISYQIRGAVFDVYNELGPGLLENVYEQALIIELQNKELQVQNQVPIEVLYKGFDLGLILYLSWKRHKYITKLIWIPTFAGMTSGFSFKK